MTNEDLYAILSKIAESGQTITYGRVARLAGGNPLRPSTTLFRMLTEIAEQENDSGRPLLSVVVVRADTGMPGAGFFDLARRLGLLDSSDGSDEEVFFRDELRRVHEHWAEENV